MITDPLDSGCHFIITAIVMKRAEPELKSVVLVIGQGGFDIDAAEAEIGRHWIRLAKQVVEKSCKLPTNASTRASVIGMNKNEEETVGYLKRHTERIVLGPYPIGITLQLKITIE
jgi:acetoin utilization deacetylase AcuC-like enzyme